MSKQVERTSVSWKVLLPAMAVLFGFATAAWPFWERHVATSYYFPVGPHEPHPGIWTITLVVPHFIPAGGTLCVEYSRVAKKLNKGSIVFDGEVHRSDGSTERFFGQARVRGNSVRSCYSGGGTSLRPLEGDDVVLFFLTFRKMPSLKAHRGHWFAVTGALETSIGPPPARSSGAATRMALP